MIANNLLTAPKILSWPPSGFLVKNRKVFAFLKLGEKLLKLD